MSPDISRREWRNGFIHLINSGATALDGSGAAKNAAGEGCMKPFWEMSETDVKACLAATEWCRADYGYFRGGGFFQPLPLSS